MLFREKIAFFLKSNSGIPPFNLDVNSDSETVDEEQPSNQAESSANLSASESASAPSQGCQQQLDEEGSASRRGQCERKRTSVQGSTSNDKGPLLSAFKHLDDSTTPGIVRTEVIFNEDDKGVQV